MGSQREHFEGHRLTRPDAPSRPALRVGLDHEAALDERDRRRGAHYTPYSTARAVVEMALSRHDAREPSIVDPCCGGGVFLIAALDALVARGTSPVTALHSVSGFDVDPGAVAASRAALAEWAVEHGVTPMDLITAVSVADVLSPRWRPLVRPDVVVGNPPFAGRLRAETAAVVADADDARGQGFGPYTDASALIWAASVGWIAEGGVVALILPRSVMAARDAMPARVAVLEAAHLSDLWVPPRVFKGVEIVVPVLRHGTAGGATEVLAGAPPHTIGTLEAGELGGATWAPALALASGVPPVGPGGPPLGEHAVATAGFRDLFYAVASAVREGDPSVDALRVASTAMVDPGVLRWGERAVRIGGRRWERPVVDRTTLETSPRVAAWVDRLRRPKLLVASQTRVIEAAPDPLGNAIALTPLVAVVPVVDDEYWLVLAALCAPPATAWALARVAGTGLSSATLRVSADLLRQLPTPPDRGRWRAASQALADGARVDDIADDLTAAWDCDPSLTTWWRTQLPAGMRSRSGAS